MKTYSYHIFYFPFKWNVKGFHAKTFSEEINLQNIHLKLNSNWERTNNRTEEDEKSLYNEKNYYYKFVHKILYDSASKTDNLIMHFERKECKEHHTVQYIIKKKDRDLPFSLDIESININIYSTGVGFLSFYLANNDDNQKNPEDILAINQYGRRIMPPFFDDIQYRGEISEYIRIDGLSSSKSYFEDFKEYTVHQDWKQATFITNLIEDLSDNIIIEPIIDDRMFVASWYKNNGLVQQFKDNADFNKSKDFSSFWYKYIFVDSITETCQNDKMKYDLLESHTYSRWQKQGSLYGCSRYSMVFLTTTDAPLFLFSNFNTIYAKMIELVLVQRASTLRFSEAVATVSSLANQEVGNISVRVSSLYQKYILFVNQIYFRSVTAQDQGVELYTMLQNNLNLANYIKDLDHEINELFNYVSLKEERAQNDKATFLNNIAVLFLPISFIVGFFGMNSWCDVLHNNDVWKQGIALVLGFLFAICIIFNRKKKL